MPESEREVFPIAMRDKIQIVGNGDVDHVLFDGGLRVCFISENHPGCVTPDLSRPGNARIFQAVDMSDQRMQDLGNTCFEPDDPNCLSVDDPDYAYLSIQPNWSARGSRNLLSNFTVLRAAKNNEEAIRVATSQDFANRGLKSSLRISKVKFLKVRASTYSVAQLFDSDILMDEVLMEQCRAVPSGALVLLNRSILTVDRSVFRNNEARGGSGLGILQASTSEVRVLNSTFTNNNGGAVYFHADGHGSVHHSTFARNTEPAIYVHPNARTPVIIANNIFDVTQDGASHLHVRNAAKPETMIYNNLMHNGALPVESESGGRTGLLALNASSWGADNASGLTNTFNPGADDVSLRNNSLAIDAASSLPVPEPNSVASNCVDDVDCINGDRRESKWNLRAYICDAGECVVDTDIDTDGDGFNDWIEIVFAGFRYNDGTLPGPIYTPETDRYDVPNTWSPPIDIDGANRPSGPAKDQGAFEFTQAVP